MTYDQQTLPRDNDDQRHQEYGGGSDTLVSVGVLQNGAVSKQQRPGAKSQMDSRLETTSAVFPHLFQTEKY